MSWRRTMVPCNGCTGLRIVTPESYAGTLPCHPFLFRWSTDGAQNTMLTTYQGTPQSMTTLGGGVCNSLVTPNRPASPVDAADCPHSAILGHVDTSLCRVGVGSKQEPGPLAPGPPSGFHTTSPDLLKRLSKTFTRRLACAGSWLQV